MRNLKKFLAVVLALAMTFSLMVSASAAFTDADKIDSTYAESVEVLAGLGVFKGYTDGSFNPQGDITRKEVAAIIYRITTGDVEDKQAALYAGTAAFSDVPTNEWYAGYVGFCANAGYVNGYEDGTFRPDNKVTGFEALAMVLRAIGYDAQNEFSGAKWSDNIAWVANNREITKDVKPGVLNGYASRELVAELLFETLMVETVAYTPAFGYRMTGTSLGYKMFDLAAFEGVLTANQYAGLYGYSRQSTGKTIIDDVKYNYTSDLTQIGLSYQGYASGSKILFIEETGDNTVFETGAATKLEGRFKKATGLYDDAEYYLNFDGGAASYKCDYRLAYGVPGSLTTIPAGKAFTEVELKAMQDIFYDDDDHSVAGQGVVFVGTQNKTDASDEMSWKDFYNKYIADSTKYEAISGSDNGEWLKVIDNDGDGDAELVFLTTFKMGEITKFAKNGDYTYIDGVKYDNDDIRTSDELSVGDVVLYTTIDGKTYVDIADVKVESVDKRGIDSKNKTITCGENVYGQSGIDYTDLGMKVYVTAADTQVSYDLYLDHFGYVRMYEESAWKNGFVLLTNGYFDSDRRADDVYKAEIWAGEYEDVLVVDGKDKSAKDADNFIESTVAKLGDDEWDRLKEAEQVYDGFTAKYATNIAGYSVNEDGEYTLIKIGGNSISNKKVYTVKELLVDKDTDLDDKTQYVKAGLKDVQATTDTVYYLVVTDAYGNQTITSWTGYKNEPADAALDVPADTVAYAVTTEGVGGEYDVAEVIVFETGVANSYDLYFVYDYTNYDAITVGYDAETEGYDVDVYVDIDDNTVDVIEFYNIFSNGAVSKVEKDYASEYIYAADVFTAYSDVNRRDYVKVTYGKDMAKTKTFYEEETIVYVVGKDGDYYVELAEDKIAKGDDLIMVCDSKGNIQYIINVTQSYDYYEAVYEAVQALWNKIDADANPAYVPTTAEKLIDKAAEALGTKNKDDLTNVKADLAALLVAPEVDKLTSVQVLKVQTLIADIDKALADIAVAEKEAADKAAAEKALNEAKAAATKAADEQFKPALEAKTWSQGMYDAAMKAVAEYLADKTAAADINADDAIAAGIEAAKKVKADEQAAAEEFANMPTRGEKLDIVCKISANSKNLYFEIKNFKFEESLKVVLYTAEGEEIGSVAAVADSHSTLLTGKDIALTGGSWYLAGANENETHWTQTGSADYRMVVNYATLYIDGEAVESIKVSEKDSTDHLHQFTENTWAAWLDKAL